MSEGAGLVFVLDDDEAVCKALSRVIKSAGYRVQAFSSARAFLDGYAAVDLACPACLVLDVQMPDLSGLDVQRELRAANAILPIVFVSGHGDIPTSVNAMKAGAVDFLTKPVSDAELLQAIRQSLAGAERMRAERARRDAIRLRFETLTPREREVMALVVTGLLNKQIAVQLGTAEKTIKVHRARVMEKMQVDSLAELVQVAERAGIGRPPDH